MGEAGLTLDLGGQQRRVASRAEVEETLIRTLAVLGLVQASQRQDAAASMDQEGAPSTTACPASTRDAVLAATAAGA